MTHANQEIIHRFFEAYGKHDMDALREVMAEDVTWNFPGRSQVSGVIRGLPDVVAFFDRISQFEMRSDTYVTGANDDYIVEAQRTYTVAPDSDFEMEYCVLWRFADGKIVNGTHLCADQHRADAFFDEVAR
ncbi:nuclear transport factor 2 family protein [Spirillospora sp. NPDC049652]